MTNPDSPINQKVKARLVNREVKQSASYLIQELRGIDQFYDDLSEVLYCEDYKSPVEWHVNNEMCIDDCTSYLNDQDILYIIEPTLNCLDDLRKLVLEDIEEEMSWQDFAEENNIDSETNEALEHWIVSDWFANQLLNKDEMVIKDFMGFNIWGRTCSGQSIFMDGVISEITSDMEILEGQENHKHWAE